MRDGFAGWRAEVNSANGWYVLETERRKLQLITIMNVHIVLGDEFRLKALGDDDVTVVRISNPT
jgi:hypothetical protein